MRKLVTCPFCNTDQHTYAKKIARHERISTKRWGDEPCPGNGLALDDRRVLMRVDLRSY